MPRPTVRHLSLTFAFAFLLACGTATIDGLGDPDTGSEDGTSGGGDTGGASDTGGTVSDAGTGEDSGPGEDAGPIEDGGGSDATPSGCMEPNPAGCPGNACADGLVCVRGAECLPSSCECDEATGAWTCTEDCGGGICVEPGDPCEGDADCPDGMLCTGGSCEMAGCGDEFAPVCGVDGVTYPNACTARVARVEIASEGICEDTVPCDEDEECVVDVELCEEGICVACPALDVCDACPEYYEFGERNGCETCTCEPIRECERDADCGSGLDCYGVGVCRDDCPSGDPSCCEAAVCQPFVTECDGPNPQGCSEGTCGLDEVCEIDEARCLPSSCFCEETTGEWVCTDDCGGGICVPDTTRCISDDECTSPEVCERGVCTEIGCDEVYAPVCGVDGVTYGNECEARVAHADIAYEGECRAEICRSDFACEIGFICEDGLCVEAFCPDIYDPVCGEDGRTYGNECEARAAHVGVAYEGECEAEACRGDVDCPIPEVCERGVCVELACLDIYDPVCGVDGETYPNECEARRAHVTVAYEGECDSASRCRIDDDCPIPELCEAGVCADILCPRIYDPVCGDDGMTYSNECEARKARVRVIYAGECGDPLECVIDTDCISPEVCEDGVCLEIPCPLVYIPVCGVDGVTYGNECEARRAHAEIAYEGVCEAACESNRDCRRGEICYPPTQLCQEPCAISCLIPDPVCGTDGVTYTCGEADAWCSGVEVAYDGECRGVPIPEEE